jgi:enolase
MADKFYSVSLGEQMEHLVTEGSSTSGEAIELRVNDTMYTNKLAVQLALETLEYYIATKETSPIA